MILQQKSGPVRVAVAEWQEMTLGVHQATNAHEQGQLRLEKVNLAKAQKVGEKWAKNVNKMGKTHFKGQKMKET